MGVLIEVLVDDASKCRTTRAVRSLDLDIQAF